MRRYLGWIAIGWLLLVAIAAVTLYGNAPTRQSLGAESRSVAAGLRCLVCQGESVADSPSGFAAGIRSLIRRDLRAGESPAQIDQFLVSRYGDRILMAPPARGIGNVVWLAPPLLVLGSLALLAILVMDWRQRGRAAPEVPADAYLERVRVELAGE